jgi:hypothetical protein
MTPPTGAAPRTAELGHPGYSHGFSSILTDDIEETAELKWPLSVLTYEKMRRTSGKVGQTFRAITLPLRRNRFSIVPNGARDEIVARLAEEIDLPIRGVDDQDQPRRRRARNRFSFKEHWREALESLIYGHMAFYQVWRPDSEDYFGMKKLSPRMPHTISDIKLARDGMVESIKQTPASFSPGISSYGQAITIPIEELVWYAIDRVGSNWVGASILRQAYPHWLVQHRMIRVDAMTKERNGMGLPIMERTIADIPTPEEEMAAEAVARKLRAGEFAGARVPYGWRLRILGVEGSLPDTLGSAKWHGEEISGSMLTQFLGLGMSETGSRAVGEVHQEVYRAALMAVSDDLLDVFNQHQVEDWVDLNWGETEAAPKVVADEIDEELTEDAIEKLVSVGALKADRGLRKHIRRTRHLPEEDDIEEEPEPTGQTYKYDLDYRIVTIDERRSQIGLPPMPNGEGAKPPVAPDLSVTLEAANTRRRQLGLRDIAASDLNAWREARQIRASEGRRFRRELFEHELRAQTNFLALEARYRTALQSLIDRWKDDVRPAQLVELAELIQSAIDEGDIETLGELSLSAGDGPDIIEEILTGVAENGAADAAAEASLQGAGTIEPDLDEALLLLRSRAVAIDSLLRRSLADAGARKALQLTGGSLSGSDVAQAVTTHIESLSDAFLEEQFTGAITAAENSGRTAVLRDADPTTIYASELLDEATCDACADIDGKEYATLEEAETDYPTGGYVDCAGGQRCRGTLVAVYGEAPATQ